MKNRYLNDLSSLEMLIYRLTEFGGFSITPIEDYNVETIDPEADVYNADDKFKKEYIGVLRWFWRIINDYNTKTIDFSSAQIAIIEATIYLHEIDYFNVTGKIYQKWVKKNFPDEKQYTNSDIALKDASMRLQLGIEMALIGYK